VCVSPPAKWPRIDLRVRPGAYEAADLAEQLIIARAKKQLAHEAVSECPLPDRRCIHFLPQHRQLLRQTNLDPAAPPRTAAGQSPWGPECLAQDRS